MPDKEQILQQLANTLSPDNALRKQSESLLLSADPTIVPQLLQLLLDPETPVPFQLELVALTLIKNRIAKDWNPSNTELNSNIKKLITQCLFKFDNPFQQSNNTLIKSALRIINLILITDTSSFQNELLQFSHNQITQETSDKNNFYIGTLIIKQIAKRNRTIYVEGLMNNIVNNFVPAFSSFLNSYYDDLTSGKNDQNDSLVAYEILKAFNYMITRSIPEGLQKYENLVTTSQIISHILQIQFTHLKNFRLSKWIFRYFIKLQLAKTDLDIGTIFTSQSNESIISNILSNIDNVLDNDDEDHVKTRCIYFFITFLTKLLDPETYGIISPNLDTIISHVITKLLTLSSDEVDNFQNDPIEFINSNIGSQSDFITPDLKSAASTFIKKLTKKEETIQPLTTLANGILTSNTANSVPCALTILKHTQQYIGPSQFTTYLHQLAQINESLNESNLWVRALIYDFFATLKLEFNPIEQFKLQLSLSTSQPLPILIATIKLFINNATRSNIDAVQIMQILLTVNDTESLEIIVDLIDDLVDVCRDQLGPYSLELITNLSASFIRSFDDEEQDEESVDKHLGILNNILTILLSHTNDKAMIMNLNNVLQTTINLVLENGLLDYLESVLELVAEINLHSEQTLNLDQVVDSFKNYGFNYFEYYELYFESAYCFATTTQSNQINELVNWILQENPAGLDPDDLEFYDFISHLVSEMVVSKSNIDDSLSDDLYSKTFEMIYNMYDDRDEFWNEKSTYRFILAGVYAKPNLLVSILGDDNIGELLHRFQSFIECDGWKTLYDVKLGILSLVELVKLYSNNVTMKQQAMSIISHLCDSLTPAIEHRQKLKLSLEDATAGDEDVEFEIDDEYDELTKKSALDNIDVFPILNSFVEQYNN